MKAFKDIYELRHKMQTYAKYLGLDSDKVADEFNEFLFAHTSKISLKDIEEENKQEEKKEEEQQEEKQEEQEEQKVLKTLYVSKQSINLRKEANTNSEIVTTLPVNMAVEVYEELNGWS